MTRKKSGKRRKVAIFSILFLIIAGLSVAAFLKRKDVVIAVETEPVKRRDITEIVLADGRIEPVVQVKISPEVSGEIIELPVREGQKVLKGELLVEIKPDFYKASVQRAEAGHQQALAALDVSQAEEAQADLEFKRQRKMFDDRIVSQAEFDEAQTALDVAKARSVQSEHQVEMANASLISAREDLLKTTIRSPINGTVSKLNSEIGERVLGTAQNMGTEIMVVSDLNEMEARVEIGEIDIVLIKPGQIAELEVDAFRDCKFTGTVTEIGNSALRSGGGTQQQATRFEVRIKINEKEEFRPGMSVSADIQTRYRTNVLAVPIQCVTRRLIPGKSGSSEHSGNTNSSTAEPEGNAANVSRKTKPESDPVEVVFLARDGKAIVTPVTRGISDDDYVEITAGIEEGDIVITGGYRAIDRDLNDGARIRKREKAELKEKTGKPDVP